MNGVVLQSTINSLSIAIVVMSVLVMLSLAAIIIMYRHFHKLVVQQDKIIGQLRNDMGLVDDSSATIDQRLAKLEKKAKFLSRRQYLYEVRQMQDKSYERAKNMINRGDEVNKVIKECKITKTEAELILLANRMNRVA